MPNVNIDILDTIQLVNEKIVGIESAPIMENSPTSLDTLRLPCALTDFSDGTQWVMDCRQNKIVANLTTTVYVEAYKQNFYGAIRTKVYTISGNFRDKYLDQNTYIDEDAYQKVLVNVSGLKVYITPGTPFSFSGYVGNLEYPLGSGAFFHGFRVSFSVIALTGGC